MEGGYNYKHGCMCPLLVTAIIVVPVKGVGSGEGGMHIRRQF